MTAADFDQLTAADFEQVTATDFDQATAADFEQVSCAGFEQQTAAAADLGKATDFEWVSAAVFAKAFEAIDTDLKNVTGTDYERTIAADCADVTAVGFQAVIDPYFGMVTTAGTEEIAIEDFEVEMVGGL